jgi:hypothetical protein
MNVLRDVTRSKLLVEVPKKHITENIYVTRV